MPIDFAARRKTMIETQLKPNGIHDARVLDAIDALPRELFVPAGDEGLAYLDEDLSFGPHWHMMEPMAMARMAQIANVQENETALVVGCGVGYEASVLAMLGATIVAINGDTDPIQNALSSLEVLAEKSLFAYKVSDLRQGYPDEAPYDIVFVNGAISDLPQSYVAQLQEDTGRIVAVCKDSARAQGRICIWRRNHDGVLTRQALDDCNVPYLHNFEPEAKFAL